jgi:hypothetical protein
MPICLKKNAIAKMSLEECHDQDASRRMPYLRCLKKNTMIAKMS